MPSRALEELMDNKRVLVVDDEPFMRTLLIDLISDLNVQSDEAEDGMVALERLKQNEYHLVISDIRMPNLGGIELLENALKLNILTPFIFLTGYSDDLMILKAIKLGAVDFIGKPFLPIELSNVISRTLELGQRRLEIANEIRLNSPHLLPKKKN